LRFGLFVEGTTVLTPNGRTELTDLWHEICRGCSSRPTDTLSVHGFTKFQLVAMGDPPQARQGALARADSSKIPLDVVVSTTLRQQPFDVLVVAFDAHPPNQHLRPAATGATSGSDAPCQHDELSFVLKHFSRSKVLPDRLKREAAKLLALYARDPKAPPRSHGRPPRGSLDLLYMDPEFEGLVLSDDAAVRRVFSFDSRPKDWPTMRRTDRPKDVLRRVVDRWRRFGPLHLRDTYDRHPHAWAREVVRKAKPGSRLWAHPIAQRLAVLLG
jgi:hypothetical protein